jgi:hypothetical protein
MSISRRNFKRQTSMKRSTCFALWLLGLVPVIRMPSCSGGGGGDGVQETRMNSGLLRNVSAALSQEGL